MLAAKRRQNAAHGASRGFGDPKMEPSPEGAKENNEEIRIRARFRRAATNCDLCDGFSG
jgi:hypothetical protein